VDLFSSASANRSDELLFYLALDRFHYTVDEYYNTNGVRSLRRRGKAASSVDTAEGKLGRSPADFG
jgi:hypothetical protein